MDTFEAALARVHSDYLFYIGCQTEPESTLAGYELSPAERLALSDPDELARVLTHDLRPRNLPSITVKISGRHDWVNRSPKKTRAAGERVVREVAAIRSARSEDRADAVLRLVERIG